jgi:hypothetical protein
LRFISAGCSSGVLADHLKHLRLYQTGTILKRIGYRFCFLGLTGEFSVSLPARLAVPFESQ